MAKIELNSNFKEFNKTKLRYRIAKGSAGSGKSVNVATDYIIKLGDEKYKGSNLLVIRKIAESNKQSTFAELLKAIYKIYGDKTKYYWDITSSPMKIKNRITGGEIIFQGMKDDDQREKVKSVTFASGSLTWIWIEEATELDEADIEILDDRLRGKLGDNLFYQITLTFNPVSATHWIKKKYFDVPNEDTFVHHSTYLQNRFIDEAYHKRMMRRKEQDQEGYRVYGLGEWGELGGLILNNVVFEDFSDKKWKFEEFDNKGYAQDFGYNHANVILSVAEKDECLYVFDEIYEYEKDTSEFISLAIRKGLDKRLRMICDSAEPDRIKMWSKAGYNATGVKKYQGSVNAQIDKLKQYKKIYINVNCPNTWKEAQQWKWKKNKDGVYIDTPVDFFDDAMASLRYSTDLFSTNSTWGWK